MKRDAADPAAARRGPLGMYARGVEFMERRKRAAAAAEAARLAEEEKECTFRPKPATRVPGFMRVIAAKMRRGGDASFIKGDETLETRTLKKGPEEALVNAARRREGWLASPTFSLSGWAESLGITSGDVSGGGSLGKGASERSRSFGGFGGSAAGSVDGGSAENHASATVRAGGVSFPSAPADHPARRRAGAHVPIKSAMSHYGFRDAGARSATDALEDARLAAKAAEAAHAANLEVALRRRRRRSGRASPHGVRRRASAAAARDAARERKRAGYYRDVDRRADRGGVRARLPGRSRKYIRRRGRRLLRRERRASGERDARARRRDGLLRADAPGAETTRASRGFREGGAPHPVRRLELDEPGHRAEGAETRAQAGHVGGDRPATAAHVARERERDFAADGESEPLQLRRRKRRGGAERRRGGGGGAQAPRARDAFSGDRHERASASRLAARRAARGRRRRVLPRRAAPGARPRELPGVRADFPRPSARGLSRRTRVSETRGVRKREGLRGGPTTEARARRRVCTVGRTFHRAKTLRRNATARRRRRVAPFSAAAADSGPGANRTATSTTISGSSKVRGSTTRSSSDDVKLLRRFLTY